MINFKTSLKIVSANLALCFILACLPSATVNASNGGSPFQIYRLPPSVTTAAKPIPQLTVDIWTNKGGQGSNVPGGQYQLGETPTIYYTVSIGCQVNVILTGPLGTKSSQQQAMHGIVYTIQLGVAEAEDSGQWQVVLQAMTMDAKQSASDTTMFTVVGPPSPSPILLPPTTPPSPETEPGPIPAPGPPPSPGSPPAEPPDKGEVIDTLDVEKATELLALTALKMAEGKLPPDTEMDIDKDGQVTQKDASLILKWAVKGADSETSQPPQQSGSPDTPELQILPPVQEDDRAIIPQSADVDTQDYEGKWEMTRQSIQPPMPDLMPDFLINQIIPQKATWVIEGVNDDLTIKYNGRDTWYKKLLLGKGLTEASTAATIGSKGASCLFETPVKFHWESLPFPLNFIASNIKQIKGSFTDSVNVSVSGNNISATINIKNVQGTFKEKDKNGNFKTEQIHYSSKIVYKGTRK